MDELDHNLTYIVGVSGGVDSMSLVDMMRVNGYHIVICHVNYHLRKEEDTKLDYHIVSSYASKYDIPFYYKEVLEYEEGNFQNIAREIRYQFFEEVGRKYGTNHVVVAHHKDDIYETILLQKERDIRYLYLGLKKESKVGNVIVHRVLLDLHKSDLIHYCKEHEISYHDDYTNFETHFRRDYIRNVVLKNMSIQEKDQLLEEANRHNQLLSARKEYIESLIHERVNLKEIKEEDLDDVIYYMCTHYVKRVSLSLVETIKNALKKEGNCKIDLPVNFAFIKEYDNIYIEAKKANIDYEYSISALESLDTPYFHIESSGHIYDGIGVSEKDFPITIRNFRNGDRIETKIGYKKVNRVFIDRKIPMNLRKTWPIVVNKDGEIILIPHIMKKYSYFNVKANLFVIKY